MLSHSMRVQEILSNRPGMNVEEQILVCYKPTICRSVELFLRALVADAMQQQHKTLLPVLIAGLPKTSK